MNEERVEAIVREEEYGEAKEKDDDQQLELQDESEKETIEIQTEPKLMIQSLLIICYNYNSKEMIIQDNSQIQDEDDQSHSPPLHSQINKENTPDYLEVERQMIK